jgi:hypothetical protein
MNCGFDFLITPKMTSEVTELVADAVIAYSLPPEQPIEQPTQYLLTEQDINDTINEYHYNPPQEQPQVEPEQVEPQEPEGIYQEHNLIMLALLNMEDFITDHNIPFQPWIEITQDPEMIGWEMRIVPVITDDDQHTEVQIRRINDHFAPALTYNNKRSDPFEHRYQQYRINSHTMRSVHRIVATQLIENPDNLPQVDHIDGNRHNNHPGNLRWCTAKQNRQWAIERQNE